jgi:serine/threonine-protein kinase
MRIRSEPAPPLGRRATAVPAAVERIVQRCLEKMPSDRFQSAEELSDALEQAARELGVRDTADAIRAALSDAGFLASSGSTKVSERPRSVPPRSDAMTLARASAGLFVAFIVLVSGATLIQVISRRHESRAGAQGGQTRLELVPQSVAYLRVVAHPWAHVIVDGQQVETTPFARPIPLGAGTHYVRLEHPNAPAEQRTIELAPGETLLLDVSLKVAPPAADAGTEPGFVGADGAVPDDASP